MTNQHSLFGKTDFEAIYNNMTESSCLYDVLMQMQTDNGVDGQTAHQQADYLAHRVALFEGVRNSLCEDSEEVLDDILFSSKKLQSDDRKLLLQKISFGLHMYQDEDLIEQYNSGASPDELFSSYYAEHGDAVEYTADYLEYQLRREIASFRVSPKVMKAIARKLKWSDDLAATSAALSDEGNRFKCIVAMNLYLNNQDSMTIDDAVNIACTGIEVEAVADAVARGRMAADIAHKILSALIIATIFLGLRCMCDVFGEILSTPIDFAEVNDLRNKSLFIWLLSGVLMATENKISEYVGKLASKYCFYRSKKLNSASDSIEALADSFAEINDGENINQYRPEWATDAEVEEELQSEGAILF